MNERKEQEDKINNYLRLYYYSFLALIFNPRDLSIIFNTGLENFISQNNYEFVEDQIVKLEFYLRPREDKKWMELLYDFINYLSGNEPESFLKADPYDMTSDLYKNFRGFRLSWLLERFYIDELINEYPQLSDLPLHGWVIEGSLGVASESIILAQAIISFSKAKRYIEKYKSLVNDRLLVELSQNEFELSSTLHSLTTFSSMQTFLNFMTFIECFVNSVAYDYCIAYDNYLNKDQKSFLSDNWSFNIPTLMKLHYYPIILTSKTDYDLPKNMNNIKNLFKGSPNESLYAKYIELSELRNSYIHHSQNPDSKHRNKSNIVMNHFEWFNKANEAFHICLRIAKQFWMDCGKIDGPKYLYNLNENYMLTDGDTSFLKEIIAIGHMVKDFKINNEEPQ